MSPKYLFFFIAALVCGGEASWLSESRLDHQGHERGLRSDYVDCEVEMISLDEGRNKPDSIDFRCITYSDEEEDHQQNMVYDLPEWITRELQQRLGNGDFIKYIRIMGAHICRHAPRTNNKNHLRSSVVQEDTQDRIVVDEDAVFIVIEAPLHNSRRQRRLKTSTTGTHKVLVARVTTLDAEVSLDAATISDRIFGDKAGTVKTLYQGCSFNKLQVVPATGPEIVGGVTEIAISSSMQNIPVSDFENEIIAALQEKVGSLDQFQHFMLCVPRGSKSRRGGSGSKGWTAYAVVGGSKSVFNDLNCGYLGILVSPRRVA